MFHRTGNAAGNEMPVLYNYEAVRKALKEVEYQAMSKGIDVNIYQSE
jgi:hypothetical protein